NKKQNQCFPITAQINQIPLLSLAQQSEVQTHLFTGHTHTHTRTPKHTHTHTPNHKQTHKQFHLYQKNTLPQPRILAKANKIGTLKGMEKKQQTHMHTQLKDHLSFSKSAKSHTHT